MCGQQSVFRPPNFVTLLWPFQNGLCHLGTSLHVPGNCPLSSLVHVDTVHAEVQASF